MKLAPITGFFGANSSGKTSIIQALLMLKQTSESPDRQQVLEFGNDSSLVRLGTFRDVIFNHDQNRPLGISLEWNLPKSLKITDPERPKETIFESSTLHLGMDILENGSNRIVLDEFHYDLAGHQFGLRRVEKKEKKYELFSEGGEFKFRQTRGRPHSSLPPVKCYGFPDEVRAAYQNAGFVAELELAFETMFSHVYYLGPLREYPKREYIWAGSLPADMGQRGERVIEALLAARDRGDTISVGGGRQPQTLELYVAGWLRKLGLIHDFRVEQISDGSSLYLVKVRRHANTAEVLLTDVGFGVSQVLPVIALCFYVPEGSTIILEQPEIHLHPSVQSGLADVFMDAIKKRKVQIILESHSEHLLRRLQLRIAEERFAQADASLYFCAFDGHASKLQTLDLDMFGTIRNWPKDFFGDEYGELAAITRAQIRRRKKVVKAP